MATVTTGFPLMLSPSDVAPNLWVGENVDLGEHVHLGVNVVLHDRTVLHDGAVIQDGAVLGKRAVRAPHSSSREGARAPLVVGRQATVCTGAVLFEGASIG